MMPKMNGIEATKLITEKDPKAKILAITAYAPQKGKPITRKKLVEIVERHLKIK